MLINQIIPIKSFYRYDIPVPLYLFALEIVVRIAGHDRGALPILATLALVCANNAEARGRVTESLTVVHGECRLEDREADQDHQENDKETHEAIRL